MNMNKEEIFKKVLDAAFRVHTELVPGLLESAYEECLYYELKSVESFVRLCENLSVSLW